MTEWWQLAWEARALLVTSLLHAHHDGDDGGDDGDDDDDDGDDVAGDNGVFPATQACQVWLLVVTLI